MSDIEYDDFKISVSRHNNYGFVSDWKILESKLRLTPHAGGDSVEDKDEFDCALQRAKELQRNEGSKANEFHDFGVSIWSKQKVEHSKRHQNPRGKSYLPEFGI